MKSVILLLGLSIVSLATFNESVNAVSEMIFNSPTRKIPARDQREIYKTLNTQEHYYIQVTMNNQIYNFDDQRNPPTLSNPESVQGPIGIRYPGTIEISAKGQPHLTVYMQSVPFFLIKPDIIALTKGLFVISQSEVYSRPNGRSDAGRLMIHKIDSRAIEGSFYMVLDSKKPEISRIKGQFRLKYTNTLR